MSKLKKAILIVFTMLFIMNLQINTSLTKGMENGFSVVQMLDNVFFPVAHACVEGGCEYEGGTWYCDGQYMCAYITTTEYCDCDDPNWGISCAVATACVFF